MSWPPSPIGKAVLLRRQNRAAARPYRQRSLQSSRNYSSRVLKDLRILADVKLSVTLSGRRMRLKHDVCVKFSNLVIMVGH